jgi:hypothetical protein
MIPYICFLLGIILNFIALLANKFKMPVLIPQCIENEVIQTNIHHFHAEKENIRAFWICDIFTIRIPRLKKGELFYFFSVGDLLIFFGIIFSFYNVFVKYIL